MHDKAEDRRWLGPETDGRIGAPNPLLEGSQASPRWLPQSTKFWCKSRTKKPWHFLASWKEIPVKDPKTSTAVFTTITDMKLSTAMT